MWSIGIYEGESPLRLAPHPGVSNPVLAPRHVSDVPAEFLADPFMLRSGGVWHMFFEVMNVESGKGEIGMATSEDGLAWAYRGIVLAEPFHLSYPYVFEWEGEFYMTPETLKANAVRLYKAAPFPGRWAYVGPLFEGSFADPSPFRFGGRWWMFACAPPYQHDTLWLYGAAGLEGPWEPHPANPLLAGDRQRARPAGRVLVNGRGVTRFAQDCLPRYGTQVRAFDVGELTRDSYREEESRLSPILGASGDGWNALGMHHVDAHPVGGGRWLACVDGFGGAADSV